MTAPKKRATRAKPSPDPLASLKVEVHAELGDSTIKAECTVASAVDVLARLHHELERLGRLRPGVLPTTEARGEQPLYVPGEGDDGCRKRLGFSG
jgi:hypothetical protein